MLATGRCAALLASKLCCIGLWPTGPLRGPWGHANAFVLFFSGLCTFVGYILWWARMSIIQALSPIQGDLCTNLLFFNECCVLWHILSITYVFFEKLRNRPCGPFTWLFFENCAFKAHLCVFIGFGSSSSIGPFYLNCGLY